MEGKYNYVSVTVAETRLQKLSKNLKTQRESLLIKGPKKEVIGNS